MRNLYDKRRHWILLAVLCFLYWCEFHHHAFVAFVVLTMRNYVCALLGVVSARVAFAFLLPLRRSVHFFFIGCFAVFVCNRFLLCPLHTYMHTDLGQAMEIES